MNVLTSDEVNAVLEHQTAVMEQMASGLPLSAVLDSVVLALEDLMRSSRCSVLVLDDARLLRRGSAPSLPAEYSAAIDGLAPGPSAGSCGTAVYEGAPVIAVDVTTDPRWVQFRTLAADAGLRACWSSPIRCRDEVVGTFAVYHDEPYEPGARDAELVRRFTHLASLAIEHDQAAREREARLGAERANLAKSQFVTALSHELRTPLQAITGFTENLQSLDLSADQRQQALERIHLASEHILSIVDDVLDLARVEAGAMPIAVAEVDTAEVIAACVGLIQPIAERGDVHLVSDGPALLVRADRRRLQQVILNLLANAIRFSPSGATVEVRTVAVDDGARLEVTDHGPGIPASLLARLFVPFDRLGADAGREGGAGLGLVLARRLTEAMGGTLELTSTVGEGTHVSVGLPRV
ncbi:MAG: ATP-binding protein [Ilumatobacteraceae bacterium]